MGRPRSKLTEKQEKFVDAVMEGKSRHQAALAAGTLTSTPFDKSETVKQELARARQEIADVTTLKRVDVINGILDGVSCARMMADSGNIIRGWTEIAKILGHYAPEVKQINLNVNQQRIRSKFEGLSDEDLLMIAEGVVIDGEAEVVS